MKISKRKIYRRRIRLAAAAVFSVVLLFSVYLAFKKAKNAFINSDVFVVRKIYSGLFLKELEFLRDKFVGKPASAAALSYIAKYISQRHPEFKKVVVRRRFPGKIIIEAVKKTPYMQIKAGSFYYLLDEEGMVVDHPRVSPCKEYIVVYSGCGGENMKIGQKPDCGILKRVKELVGFLKTEVSPHYTVDSIHAYALNDIWFDLGGIKVKIGSSNYKQRLEILYKIIIPRFRADWKKISYIDLRFKDPVIGYRR